MQLPKSAREQEDGNNSNARGNEENGGDHGETGAIGESAARKRRNRRVISLGDKQEVIQRLDNGQKGAQVALDFGISKQQVSDIKKKRSQIIAQVVSLESSDGLRRKSLKGSRDEVLDHRMYNWYKEERARGASISGPRIQAQARATFAELHPDEDSDSFQASNGWLQRFRDRHGIRYISGRESSGVSDARGNHDAGACIAPPTVEQLSFIEAPEGFRIVAQVPGYGSEDLSISINKDELHIQGQSPINLPSQFERRIPVPPKADVHGALASCLNGVLSIVVPRIQESTSVNVPVQDVALTPFVPRAGDMQEPHSLMLSLPGFAAADVCVYTDESRNLCIQGKSSLGMGNISYRAELPRNAAISEAVASLEKGVLIVRIPCIAPEHYLIPLRLPGNEDGCAMLESSFSNRLRFGDAGFNVAQSVAANPSAFIEVASIDLRIHTSHGSSKAVRTAPDCSIFIQQPLQIVFERHSALQQSLVRITHTVVSGGACQVKEHITELDWALAQRFDERQVFAYCIDGDLHQVRLITPKDSLRRPEIFRPHIRRDCLLTLDDLTRAPRAPDNERAAATEIANDNIRSAGQASSS